MPPDRAGQLALRAEHDVFTPFAALCHRLCTTRALGDPDALARRSTSRTRPPSSTGPHDDAGRTAEGCARGASRDRVACGQLRGWACARSTLRIPRRGALTHCPSRANTTAGARSIPSGAHGPRPPSRDRRLQVGHPREVREARSRLPELISRPGNFWRDRINVADHSARKKDDVKKSRKCASHPPLTCARVLTIACVPSSAQTLRFDAAAVGTARRSAPLHGLVTRRGAHGQREGRMCGGRC